MTSIHQIAAGFSLNDAISNEALALRALFRSWGHDAQIIAPRRRIHPDLREGIVEFESYQENPGTDDLLLLHLSTGSPVNEAFAALPGRKIIRYHNVTPPHYFEGGFSRIAAELAEGRRQVEALVGTADIHLAVSQFNAEELKTMGYPDATVIPILLQPDVYQPVDESLVQRYRDGLFNVLFVGRGAPNKRIEDLLHAFHVFQTCVEPQSRLIHVGSYDVTRKYYDALLALARNLGIQHFVPLGSVGQNKLNAAYRCADLFLCLSEHEGFCIPLLEAMRHDLPVMAYDAGAVRETMDGAGILIREKRFDQIAEMMGKLARDPGFKANIVAGQRERIERIEALDLEQQWRKTLEPVLNL
ncbi:MAG: glycosyltransferase [Verrucomicrobiota bacterium]